MNTVTQTSIIGGSQHLALIHGGNFNVTKTPIQDIMRVAYKGQNPDLRQYRNYSSFLARMPKMHDDDLYLVDKFIETRNVLEELSTKVAEDKWFDKNAPNEGKFKRTIIAMEAPIKTKNGIKEGAELVVAQWGNNFQSPVHGHNTGYMHEEIIKGKFLVNMFRLHDEDAGVVRPVVSFVKEKGVFVSEHNKANSKHKYKRQTLIHNFRSIGATTSLHYLPEHTRDGRDNGFIVERFGDVRNIYKDYVKQLSTEQALEQLQIGDVAIVRSANVPELGDHYVVIVGDKVMKANGLRQQDKSIDAPDAKGVLDAFEPINGLTLLKLKKELRKEFLEFHGIKVIKGIVTFPKY